MKRTSLIALLFVFALAGSGLAQGTGSTLTNRAERLEWFRDQGFGLFIHWSLDSQLGSVISHSMVGADENYLNRFINDLPRSFNPRKFTPQDWAALAKLAGVKYVMFTTKHHSGFCMFDTATTEFSIAHTPFKRDITAELFQAFRDQGIAPGVYFSPDDFWWLHKNGLTIQRGVAGVQPRANPGLMAHDQAQVRELLTKYGPIDLIFFDGEAEGLRDLAWQLQPNIIVTRGALQTPEQYVPGVPLEGAWEANLTMGTQWQYKPTNEQYKSGGELLALLIETRAKGGNLLLNVGPKPDGELPIEQEERLREVALWMFVNSECIYGVRPWIITNEKDYWFTRKKDSDTLYVIVKEKERWKHGAWKELVLHSVRATDQTEATVLSQNDKVVEYQGNVVPKTTWKQEADGLHLRAMRAQRLYNDRKWPNPVVLKLTHVQPALLPPQVDTVRVRWNGGRRVAECELALQSLGDAKSVQLGAEARDVTGLDVNERTDNWQCTPLQTRESADKVTVAVEGLQPGHTYEIRAVVKHPLLTTYGRDLKLQIP